MPDTPREAEEEKDKLGRHLLQILAQEDTLASVLAELEDLKAKLRGYDYTGKVYKDLAIDPATKALLVKHTAPDHGACTGLGDDDHPQYFLVTGTRTADILIITDGAGHYLQVPKLTTAQRDALVASNGMIIYNTTTNQLERYEAGSWGVFAGGGDMLKSTYDTDGSDVVDKAEDLDIANQAAGDILYFDGTNWIRLGKDVGKYLKSGAVAPAWDEATIGFSFAIPIDTPETVGTDKGVFHFAPGIAGTIEEVYIMAKTAPGTDKTLTVDVNKGGVTIFTTQENRPSISGTNKTATSGTPDVTTFAKNDLFTIDVDVSTATTAVADVVVLIRGKQKVA